MAAFVHGLESTPPSRLISVRRRLDRTVLLEILFGRLEVLRGAERERLCEIVDACGFVDEWLSDLRSGRWRKRAQAADRLGRACAERAAWPLTLCIADEVPEVRIRAAAALGRLAPAEALQPLLDSLDRADRWFLLRLAEIFAAQGESAVQMLLNTYEKGPSPTRLACIDILGRIDSSRAAHWIMSRLDDPDPDIRAKSCAALGNTGPLVDSGPVLVQALEDSNWPVRSSAAKALGRVRHVEAIPNLCRAMRDSSWWVRNNAAHALIPMGNKGLRSLERMLRDRDRYAREQSAMVLQEAGVLDRRIDRLSGSSEQEQRAALRLVVQFIMLGRTQRIRDLAIRHPNPRIQLRLQDLLSQGPGG